MVVLKVAHMVSMSSNSVDRKVLLDEDMLERNPSISAFSTSKSSYVVA